MQKTATLLLLGSLVLLGACTRTETTRVEPDGSGARVTREVEVTPADSWREEREKGRVTASEVRQEAGEAWDKTTAYMSQEKDKMGAEISRRMGDLDKRLADLRVRADKASGPTRESLDRQISELNREKVDLQKIQSDLSQAGTSAWASVKQRFEAWRTARQREEHRAQ